VKFFSQLGDLVEKRWRDKRLDHEALPAVAAQAMRDLPPSEHFDFEHLVKLVFEPGLHLPIQTDPRREFVEFPMTVYRGERIHIEVFSWVDGTTNIHDHNFMGAFHVLSGSSVQTTYRFDPGERINEWVFTGRTSVERVELLGRGDTCAIEGPRLIHSLFHLDRPSISVLIRTNHSHSRDSLFYRPGLKVLSQYKEPLFERQLQTFELLDQLRHPGYLELLFEVLPRLDVHKMFLALMHVFEHLSHEQTIALLEHLRPQLGGLHGLFERVLTEERRIRNLAGRRRHVTGADHRYFLALLMNLSDRSSILACIGQRYPGSNPADLVIDWLRELGQIDLPGPEGPTAIGVPLDEVSLLVLRGLLDGMGPDGVKARLRSQFTEAEVDSQWAAVSELSDAFRGSLLFETLLAEKDGLRRTT
jgi:hypothetical protein